AVNQPGIGADIVAGVGREEGRIVAIAGAHPRPLQGAVEIALDAGAGIDFPIGETALEIARRRADRRVESGKDAGNVPDGPGFRREVNGAEVALFAVRLAVKGD